MRIDAVFENADVITLDPARPRARRVGVHQGRIVGLDEDLDGVEAASVHDLGGAHLVPGFNDAHNHMALYGLSRSELDISSPRMRSLDEVYAAVAEHAAVVPEGGWIVGAGYDQNKLGGHPHRDGLDRAAPGHLVWLRHTSAHMSVVNTRLLRETGILSGRPAPEGGMIVRDHEGHATGLLQEQAQQLLRELRYPYPQQQIADAVAAASEQYLREGITSCTEAGIGRGWIGHSPVEAAAYQRARDAGALRVRVQLMVTVDSLRALEDHSEAPAALGLDLGLRTGFGDDWLRLGAVKVFADGSLIGRTAAMCCDFADEIGNRGYFQADEQQLRQRIAAAHAGGWQVAAHAIGDRAIDLVLDAYRDAQAAHPRVGLRHRIEHCGVTRPDQIARIAGLGVVPVPQAAFVGGIGDGMRAALGEDRAAWCYRHRSFLDAGITVPGSSDRPIVPGAPLRAIHDMVNRLTESGAPLAPREAVTPMQALHAYTLGSAYAGFDEGRKGSIVAGKLADFAVLGADPTAIDPSGIAEISVLGTVVGGALTFVR